MAPQEIEGLCEGCEDLPGTWFCASCDCAFCDPCWDRQPPHRRGKKGVTGVPHEKTNRIVVERLREILTPSSNPAIQQQLHENDVDTAWFGVMRGANAAPMLNDYGRYSMLMQDSYTGEWPERWPQLVSFIGQTGDGKSSLIRMLIDKQCQALGNNRSADFPAPVVGAVDSNAPTSGDVHLYADPLTFFQEHPRLYADCEGLTGGEAVPLGDRSNILQTQFGSSKGYSKGSERQNVCKKGWDIKWADAQTAKMRERAVGHLYPRFLYTFSNVIVFVLRNERTFEAAALSNLLEWASRSIEGSVNQPALPHAIIALNACDHLVPDNMYDVEKSTESLLTNIDQSLTTNSALVRYIEFWRKNGKIIGSTKELICCYYSSFRVVRLPAKGRYKLLDEQITKLYTEIDGCCMDSHKTRRARRLDLNADELADSLESGFAHFSGDLDRPFDFIEMNWNLNPIPRGFGGNILRLALAIKETNEISHGPAIFSHLGPMVASCIMLDFVRHRIKGAPQQLLQHYKPSLDRALDEFCEAWWPCDYRQRGRVCVNTQRGHSKGHQDASGKLFGAGAYQSSFLADDYRQAWHHILTQNLEKIRRLSDRTSFSMGSSIEMTSAISHHTEQMNIFYERFDDLKHFSSHSACFCCVRELAEHPLPCGHVLCSPCVQSFGEKLSANLWSLDHCPMHSRDHQGWNIRIVTKPQYAGIRVLTLDGGGMRGIVELQVLTAIQRKLGGLPVQSFFDLIIGTSTGGIIALGLGVKEWSVNTCIQKFREFCDSAFMPREFSSVPILKHLAILHHRAVYKTQPLENLLKDTLGEDLLFGGSYDGQRSSLKVGVMSTSESGQGPAILSNYNRQQLEQSRLYKFERPELKASEFKVWEAARATSAAPSYFKPFINPATGRAYLDGALYHNNPVLVADAERKVIWPDVENLPPDLMLSIGTGRSRKAIERERRLLDRRRAGLPRHATDEDSIMDVPKKLLGLKLPQFLKVFQDRMTNILDAQETWDQFFRSTPSSTDSCIRINPEVDDLPALDRTDQLAALENQVRNVLRGRQWMQIIDKVVFRLIATSFYFKKSFIQSTGLGATGRIMCRFENDPTNLGQLASLLGGFRIGGFQPYFRLTENYNQQYEKNQRIVPLPPLTLRAMQEDGVFELPELIISCATQQTETMIELCFDRDRNHLAISGFPRQLVYEDELFAQREKDRQVNVRDSQFRQERDVYRDSASNIPELPDINYESTPSLTSPMTDKSSAQSTEQIEVGRSAQSPRNDYHGFYAPDVSESISPYPQTMHSVSPMDHWDTSVSSPHHEPPPFDSKTTTVPLGGSSRQRDVSPLSFRSPLTQVTSNETPTFPDRSLPSPQHPAVYELDSSEATVKPNPPADRPSSVSKPQLVTRPRAPSSVIEKEYSLYGAGTGPPQLGDLVDSEDEDTAHERKISLTQADNISKPVPLSPSRSHGANVSELPTNSHTRANSSSYLLHVRMNQTLLAPEPEEENRRDQGHQGNYL